MLSSPMHVSTSSRPSSACMRVCHRNLAGFFSSREQPSRSAAAGRAALRCALECAAAGGEPPCATVGAARVVHQALPCYRAQAQARFDIGGGGADGHQPHGLCVEPAMARMLATLGGLDSSGVACWGGTFGEEGEDGESDHARATVNQRIVEPAGKSDLVRTLEAI